jgi:protein subunit release factor A
VQNKAQAFKVLEERVQAFANEKKRERLDKFREMMYKGRVRTYDFTKNVVTDYRTKKQTKRIKDVLDGDLELIR